MKRLYFDTETTKLPNSGPLENQPHICQLAAVLHDDTLGEVASFSTLIKPDGWTIDPGAEAVHKISLAKCESFGIRSLVALAIFSDLVQAADECVAHNYAFDHKLIGFGLERLKKPNYLNDRKRFCTMEAATPICKLPGRNGNYKWPRLEEAYSFFFSETFDGAHDALVDVRACIRVHQHLLSL